MPFDPRIVRHDPAGSDDAPFEGDLPPELSSLARRLVRESTQLSSLYPAASARAAVLSARAAVRAVRPRRWLGWSAAALLAAAGSLLAVRWGGEPPVRHTPRTARELAVSGAGEAMPRGFNVRTIPTVFFHELTAPEQEAVLDLLEDRDEEPSKLSI
jgi:hypothetical protein